MKFIKVTVGESTPMMFKEKEFVYINKEFLLSLALPDDYTNELFVIDNVYKQNELHSVAPAYLVRSLRDPRFWFVATEDKMVKYVPPFPGCRLTNPQVYQSHERKIYDEF